MTRISFPLIHGLNSPSVRLNLNPSSQLIEASWDEYKRIFNVEYIVQQSLDKLSRDPNTSGKTVFDDRPRITIPLFLHTIENLSTYRFPPTREKEIRQALVDNALLYFAHCTPLPGELDAEHSPSVENTDDDFYMLALLLIKKADLKSTTENAEQFALSNPAHNAHVNLIDNLIEIAVLGISEKRKSFCPDSSRFIHDKVSNTFNDFKSPKVARVVDVFLSSVSGIIKGPMHNLEYYKKIFSISPCANESPCRDNSYSLARASLELDTLKKIEIIKTTIAVCDEASAQAWSDPVEHIAERTKRKYFLFEPAKLNFDNMPLVSSVHDFQLKLLKRVALGFSQVIIDDDQMFPLRNICPHQFSWNGFLSKLNVVFRNKDENGFNALMDCFPETTGGDVVHTLAFLKELFELQKNNQLRITVYNHDEKQYFQSLLNDGAMDRSFVYINSSHGIPIIENWAGFRENSCAVRQISSGECFDHRVFDFRNALIHAVLNSHGAKGPEHSIAIPITDRFKTMFHELGLNEIDMIKEMSVPLVGGAIPLSDIVLSFSDGGDIFASPPVVIYFNGRPVGFWPVIAV